jgi:redox-sensitive bicupin YhaK (pirin superfamily)
MSDAIEALLLPKEKDLGDGFHVRRLVPQVARRAVGPFVFFDHMGPATFAPGSGLDVRPHPHIGLATVTYLFEGEILHRDSLGVVQPIRPGAVNWMVAGRGIVHSERSAPETRAAGQTLHGIQTWIALPQKLAECAPSFRHHPAETLPRFTDGAARLVLIAGSAYGRSSPVEVLSPMFYLDVVFEATGGCALPQRDQERGIYVVDGEVRLDDAPVPRHHVAVLSPGSAPRLNAQAGARVMLFGGAPLDGPRTIWWNFVSHDKARIEQAKADWRAGRFARVPGESEFIPLPE